MKESTANGRPSGAHATPPGIPLTRDRVAPVATRRKVIAFVATAFAPRPPLPPYVLDRFLEHGHPGADTPPVRFEFGFARTPGADAAAQSRQRGARAHKPWQQVLELRELDLQLPFTRTRTASKDVEDQLRPVHDLSFDSLFDLTQLCRRQLVVEDDDVHVHLSARCGEMFDLSGTEECRRVRLGPLLHYLQHDVGAGRLGQAFQFLERAFRIKTPGPARDETYERRTLGLPYSSARHR